VNPGPRYSAGGLSLCSTVAAARAVTIQALAIAQDLGAPLEEARALEGIGTSHLRDTNPGLAAPPLRQALAIYQRIGNPGDQRIRKTLAQQGL
jgi:hypothetical protein